MRRLHLNLLLAGAAGLLAVEPALAQTPKPTTPGSTVADVVVVGQKAAVKADIDRRTYAVGRDLQGATGSVSDVLRNVPSVAVAVDGNVSLRGDSSVQILIDGQPSTLMSGSTRATILQQMPANTVESIEVITNPSAQFKPDGASGVINIVTKKTFKPGRTGSLRVTAGSEGRASVNLNGALKEEKLSLTGVLAAQRSGNKQEQYNFRSTPGVTPAQTLETTRDGGSGFHVQGFMAQAGADYDATPTSRLTASLAYNNLTGDLFGESHAVTTLGGATTRDYERDSSGKVHVRAFQASGGYRRTFTEAGRLLTVNLNRTEVEQAEAIDFTNTYTVPAAANASDERRNRPHQVEQRLATEYTDPSVAGGKLVTGYELQSRVTDFDTYGGVIDPATGASIPNPAITNIFVLDETIHAAYATWQRPVGKLTVMTGLRLEETLVDTDQRTTGEMNSNDYFLVHPTLHLQYELTENQALTFSYSHRVSRPTVFDYNPFIVVADEFSASSGNPDLKPQETHSFEAGWRSSKGGSLLMANLYVRRSYNTFGPVSRFLTPSILLTTKENLGTATAGGLELTATGKFTSKVSYNTGADIFYSEIEPTYPGAVPEKRSSVGYTVKGSFDYRATPKDLIQLSGQVSGRSLTAQGYRQPSGVLNLGYQRKIRDDLSFTATVSDLLRSNRNETVLDAPTFVSINRNRPLGRTISIGFTQQFGGKVREGQFDYGGGASIGTGGGTGP